MPAITKSCSCANDYQDKKYGPNQRIFNLCKDGAKARCSVCGSEITISTPSKKESSTENKKSKKSTN